MNDVQFVNQAISLERELAALISGLLKQPITVAYQGCSRPLDHARLWFYFAYSAGETFGLSLATRAGRPLRAKAFIALCRALAELRKRWNSCPAMTAPKDGGSEALEHHFLAVSGVDRLIVDLFYTGPLDLLGAANEASAVSMVNPVLNLHFALSLTRYDLLKLRANYSLELQQPKCLLQIAQSSAWSGRCRYNQELRHAVLTVEDTMTMNAGVPIQISLGSIELSLDQVLALRPGAEIVFAHSGIFESILQIGSSAWARTEIAFASAEASLKIKSLVPLEAGPEAALKELGELLIEGDSASPDNDV